MCITREVKRSASFLGQLAALAFEWDVDDELSRYYLQKDMDKFWKKMTESVFKKECSPNTDWWLY